MSNSRLMVHKSSSVIESLYCLKRRRTTVSLLSQQRDPFDDRYQRMRYMKSDYPKKTLLAMYDTNHRISAIEMLKQHTESETRFSDYSHHLKGDFNRNKPNGSHGINIENGDTNGDSRDEKSNLIVVLDLDECLIHSKFLNSVDVFRQYESDRERHTSFNDSPHDKNETCDSFHLTLPDGERVHVHKRPNLDTFLEHVTSRYDTYIFTAGMQVYASPLLDILDPENTRFKKRFYREHCTYDPNVNAYVKDLSHVSKHVSSSNIFLHNPVRRMVLVDNNPMSFIANPQNGILVSNFYDDYSDDTLSAVADLLEELEHLDDVRPFLDEKFGLQAALSEVINGYYWNQRDATEKIPEEQQSKELERNEDDIKRQ
jgi:Dullard-like phosphatase family protein